VHADFATCPALCLTSRKVLQRVAGKDASKQFWKYHNEGILKKYKGKLQVGSLDTKKVEAPPTPPATPPPAEKEQKKVQPQAEPGTVAPAPGPSASEEAEALDPFGSLIPFGDPSWYQGVSRQLANLWLEPRG
jgi:hypothetical protein